MGHAKKSILQNHQIDFQAKMGNMEWGIKGVKTKLNWLVIRSFSSGFNGVLSLFV